jgi:hypothetical protein
MASGLEEQRVRRAITKVRNVINYETVSICCNRITMQRTLVLVLSLAFTLIVALQAQLPANLDCKCTATGDGEYLCKCVPSKVSPLANSLAKPTGTSTAATSTPFVLPEPPLMKGETPTATASTTAKGTETPTGESTAKGQPIYTGPRGGQYHYSDSGKKVYTRKK